MNVRRIIAAAISTLALVAVNVGMADTASAGSRWDIQQPSDSYKQSSAKVTTFGSRWD